MTTTVKPPKPDDLARGKGVAVGALLVAAVFVLLLLGAGAVLFAAHFPAALPVPLPASPAPVPLPVPGPGGLGSLLPLFMVALFLGFGLLGAVVVAAVGIGIFLFVGRRRCAPSSCGKPARPDCDELIECLEECLRRARRDRSPPARDAKEGG